ncbi:flavodoxin short chain [Peptoniphilus olsenii]|uniref:Flavodoxin n=1 Tax=Peptoniphilus olsenii TaxID=411570 RepID=A0ABV2J809_9FIRM
MKKINIIYWSGTGHTERMAEAIKKGIEGEGVEVGLLQVSQANISDVENCDKLAFGCPAMGAEELEEMEMRPFMDEANKLLSGKKVVLFGSYEWADGEWMKLWEEEVEDTGANIVETLICYDDPTDDDIEECERVGREIARA